MGERVLGRIALEDITDPVTGEALVEANLVTDWDLSRVVCKLYGLPFLPVEVIDRPLIVGYEGVRRRVLVVDDVPTRMTTILMINVAGGLREELFGSVLPDGFVPMLVDSPLPVRLEADGKLRALSTALKQHQKQFKLVRSTLSSLQQLQGIKAA